MVSDFSVIRSNEGLVPPHGSTPSCILDLSFIDRLPGLKNMIRSMHVFRHLPNSANVVREALAKALVPYYPMAGRFKEVDGELKIECSGEGVLFVEAYADCSLEDVGHFDDLTSKPWDNLFPEAKFPLNEGLDPLVLIQVTQFKCDGFVMGLMFCHSICDGFGIGQFLNAVGEMARGLNQLSVTPVWKREFLKLLLRQQSLPHVVTQPPPILNYRLERTNIDISLDHIEGLKKKFYQLTDKTCSAFEIIAASVWSARACAINLDKNTQLKLVFFANCRHMVDPHLPKGFYGNCFFPMTVTASTEMLMSLSIVDVVKMIQDAKGKLGSEFQKWVRGELTVDPFEHSQDYSALFITDWGRLGLNRVDYGHGPPDHVAPVQGSTLAPYLIVVSRPWPNKGIRLMTWCVQKPHLQAFVHHTTKLF